MTYTETQKKAIYNWIENNRDKFNEIQRASSKRYYDKTGKQKKHEYYLRKKQEKLDALKESLEESLKETLEKTESLEKIEKII